MPGFDPKAFADKMDDYIEIADDQIKQKYKLELAALNGLSAQQIEQCGGSTEQLDAIIKAVENAKDTNLKQAGLIAHIKSLGQGTYELAKKISDLVP